MSYSPDCRLGLLKDRASGTAQPPLRTSPLSTSSRREPLSVCLPHGARLATNVEQTLDESLGHTNLGHHATITSISSRRERPSANKIIYFNK